jgi:DNA-binding LacI/PurR family transcriptional regulator
LLELSKPPSAIFCANDTIAACVLQVANELNIKVPGELSVVGMTNERMSQLTIPSLTTVGIPGEEIGHAGMMALIELIESKRELATQEIARYPCSPVFRDSSAAARSL